MRVKIGTDHVFPSTNSQNRGPSPFPLTKTGSQSVVATTDLSIKTLTGNQVSCSASSSPRLHSSVCHRNHRPRPRAQYTVLATPPIFSSSQPPVYTAKRPSRTAGHAMLSAQESAMPDVPGHIERHAFPTCGYGLGPLAFSRTATHERDWFRRKSSCNSKKDMTI